MNNENHLCIRQSNNASRLLFPVTSDLCEGLYGYTDTYGKMVIEPRFDMACEFSEGLAAVRGQDKDRKCRGWGFIDNKGHWAIQPRFEWVSSFVSGQAWAGVNDSSILLDRKGHVVRSLPEKIQIEPEMSRSDTIVYSHIAAWIRSPGYSTGGWFWRPIKKYGLIASSGDLITDPILDFADYAGQDLVIAKLRGRMGYVDYGGRVVTGWLKILGGYAFSEGLAAVQAWDRCWGYIDTIGKTIIPPKFEEATPFNEGLAPVKPVGKDTWEFIDPAGRTVVQLSPEIQWVDSFSEGLASVKINDHYSYIDSQGDLAFAPQDFQGGEFQQGYAEAYVGLVKTYIDRQGRIIWMPKGIQGRGEKHEI